MDAADGDEGKGARRRRRAQPVEARGRAKGSFEGVWKTGPEDAEVGAAVARRARLFEGVGESPTKRSVPKAGAHGRRRERLRGEVDAVAQGGAGDVGAVVDEQARVAGARDGGGARGEFVEGARRETLLGSWTSETRAADAAFDEREDG